LTDYDSSQQLGGGGGNSRARSTSWLGGPNRTNNHSRNATTGDASGRNEVGDESTWEEPTDSELLVHVVCVWLDESLRLEAAQPSFKDLHVRSLNDNLQKLCADKWWGILDCGKRLDTTASVATAKPQDTTAGGGAGAGRAGVMRFTDQFGEHLSPGARMRSGGVYVSHFKVMVQGVEWEVRGGRENALQAVALFLYSMYQHGVGKDVQLVEQVILKDNRARARRRPVSNGGGGNE
jgi:hypothetical protein